jgi:2,5-furandicarboxylate decarboxylase 1
MAPRTQPTQADAIANIDTESFRLSTFVDLLGREGELETVQTPTDLIDVAAGLDGNPKAVLFEKAGPEQARLVGNVMGSRRRMALAFGVSETALLGEVLQRSAAPLPPVRIPSSAAPVHQIVLQSDKADLTRLPVP